MSNQKPTQTQMIRDHLLFYGSISQREAIDMYGIYRLSARIYELRSEGIEIDTETVTGRNRFGAPVTYARYSLLPTRADAFAKESK